ncbi:MAG: PorT family protein [Bacteroidetes bacterium]|nr:PorT family protein [Bacteroidota bacterium]
MHKKISILFLFLIVCIVHIHAQEHVFRPGVLLNFNGIHVQGDNEIYWNSSDGKIWGTGGISFGAFVTYDSYKKFVGTLELRYIRKGSLYEFINTFGQREFESLKLKYIEMPVLLGMKGKTRKRDYLFETGLACGMLINSGLLFDELTERIETPNAADFRKLDLSWIADLKFHIDKRKNLLLGFRFEYSILSVHKFYNLHNMNYGIELNYFLFNKRL